MNARVPGGSASYRSAGVDVDAGNLTKHRMAPAIRSTFGPQVLTDVGPLGGFGGMFAFADHGLREPVLVASADSVGTKLKIAFALDRHDSIGIDMVNHCVNDVLTTGARPLFFLDYFGTGVLRPEVTVSVVEGLAHACREAGCALLGGETAQLPGFYNPGEYDLAGFLVGAVDRAQIRDPKHVRAGDVVIGLPSSGLHTNGYSLVRRVLGLDGDGVEPRRRLEAHVPELGRTLGEELLEPHRSYLPLLLPSIQRVTALAHITGGGLIDNVPRALPEGLGVRLDARAWQEPAIFDLIRRTGDVSDAEMWRTFNVGVGMVAIAPVTEADGLLTELDGASVIGEVVELGRDERVVIYR